MIRIFAGIVELGDGQRCDTDVKPGSVWIGGEDVVAEVHGKFAGKVTVAICDKSFSGDLDVDMGWGYSEVTPEESDKLFVGKTNVITLLEAAVGKEVVMVVADEPVNMIEVMERVRHPRRLVFCLDPKPSTGKSSLALQNLGCKFRSSIKGKGKRKR